MSGKFSYLLVLCTTLALVNSFLELKTLKFDEQRLRKFVETVMACKDIKGLQIAAVYKDKTVFTGGFGYKDISAKTPMSEHDLMGIGSNSKSFCSAVAARAVDQGKITWDGAIYNAFMKGFSLQSSYRTDHVSLRDLLSHRTGMPSYWGVTTAAPNFTLQQLARRMKYFPVLYDLRDKYLYSNYGVTLGGAAVESAMNQSWENQLQDLFQKIGMNSSRASSQMSSSDWDRVAPSYTKWKNGVWRANDEKTLEPMYSNIGPAGGVLSNAADMAKWLRFHLNMGVTDRGEQVISKRNLQETHKPVWALNSFGVVKPKYKHAATNTGYAMGWMSGIYRGYKRVMHTGEISSYAATQQFLPGAGVGVWVGSNSVDLDATIVIGYFVMDMLLHNDEWISEKTECPQKRNTSSQDSPVSESLLYAADDLPGATAAANLDDYVGNFEHPGFGTWSVSRNGQALSYTFGQLLKGKLIPTGKADIFRQTLGPPQEYRNQGYRGIDYVTFARDADNNVTTITVPYLEYRLPPTFYRK